MPVVFISIIHLEHEYAVLKLLLYLFPNNELSSANVAAISVSCLLNKFKAGCSFF